MDHASEIHLRIGRDKLAASLIIPPDFPREMLSRELCLGTLGGRGIAVTKFANRAIDSLIRTPPPIGESRTIPIAKGRAPTLGENGRLEWVVDRAEDHHEEPVSDDSKHDHETEQTSHYDRTSYQTIKANEVIARIIKPVQGEDGVDVFGIVIPAAEPKAYAIKLGPTVQRTSDGSVIALVDGILRASDEAITIEPVLEVKGVDFSTGNLDYDGDIKVAGPVKDCFEIHAGGVLEIGGLIEDAKLECKGDLIARSGFAARKHGEMHVGGNCQVRYLNQVRGDVEGDLLCEREVLHCEMHVRGALRSPTGSMVGGTVSVQGAVELSQLGSEAGVKTQLIIGSIPNLEFFLNLLDGLIRQIETKRTAVSEKQRVLNLARGKLSAQQKELQTEVMFEVSSVDEQYRKACHARDAIDRRIRRKAKVDLTIHGTMHSGVKLNIGRTGYLCGNSIRGPLRIRLNEENKVVFERGGSGREEVGFVEKLLRPLYRAA